MGKLECESKSAVEHTQCNDWPTTLLHFATESLGVNFLGDTDQSGCTLKFKRQALNFSKAFGFISG